MSRDLERRVEDLETAILPRVEEPSPPEAVMYDVITAEWVKAWSDTGEEHIEEAIDDWITRLKGCPATAKLGAQIERYRKVLIDEMRRRLSEPPPGDAGEYKEAS